ncbi:MKI67 FHA domain-interacting nucleolar phosphoprotein [Lobosporangium transversale]|uniref:RRM domain-containing protein n=1 Tax=Lobosporangium transversale TaxID=64571 RepID=A0A1Y2H203_9FUNG|nr:hypothetical protein BCR41DRAFT_317809 [Lobosporangium transversale]KAF9919146.1 MKI67 FHA domain-interacting nucleolar phosphoprotein [Lobosporangium transversale]ORZ28044.1 hypothetical protein BCR41DRAFT_317809 [Lobosporangium transversale]|eukprot:XP_021885747.1 hypothetical protein BCR41DRAFT_317809 [Lobosporangium transversale]
MPASTRASTASKAATKPASKPASATPTANSSKRKATTPAIRDRATKKPTTGPAKKEIKTPANLKKTTTTKTTPGKIVGKKKAGEKNTTNTIETPASKEEQKLNQEQEEQEKDDDEDEQLMDDRALLKDIDSSADEDSSSDDDDGDEEAKEDMFASMKDEISLSPKAAAALKKKLATIGQPKQEEVVTGVVYLGRIPHGFYEEQMKAYFSQFGKVLRLRLSRNKKTGKSKHYAFIEFASQEVAEIVADTMNNYLLFGHQLKCKALQPSQIHPAMFSGANKKFKAIPWLKIAKEKHNAEKTTVQSNQIKKKLLKNEAAKRAKLAELGIDYDFPGYKASVPEKPKHTKF